MGIHISYVAGYARLTSLVYKTGIIHVSKLMKQAGRLQRS